MNTKKWEVYSSEGPYSEKTAHPYSYSICAETADGKHSCIALVFGETDKEARQRAAFIVKAAKAESL